MAAYSRHSPQPPGAWPAPPVVCVLVAVSIIFVSGEGPLGPNSRIGVESFGAIPGATCLAVDQTTQPTPTSGVPRRGFRKNPFGGLISEYPKERGKLAVGSLYTSLWCFVVGCGLGETISVGAERSPICRHNTTRSAALFLGIIL